MTPARRFPPIRTTRGHRFAVAALTVFALAATVAAASPAEASTQRNAGSAVNGVTVTVAATTGAPTAATLKAQAFAHTHPVLHLGSRGPAVRKVQRYVGAKVTGRFTTKTRHKVRAIQRWGHLRASGVVDVATWHAAYRFYSKRMAARAARLSPKNIIKTARKYLGGRYVSGGSTPRAFDCSGYTMYVFHKLGISLPHNAAAQYHVVKHISRKNARPGDLIFFHSGSGIYHVGIWAGHGGLYHSSHPGRRTGYEKLWTSAVYFGRVR